MLRRPSLRSQLNQIRLWVGQGRTDAWIAHKLDVPIQQLDQFKREHGLHGDPPARGGLEPAAEREQDAPVTPLDDLGDLGIHEPEPAEPTESVETADSVETAESVETADSAATVESVERDPTQPDYEPELRDLRLEPDDDDEYDDEEQPARSDERQPRRDEQQPAARRRRRGRRGGRGRSRQGGESPSYEATFDHGEEGYGLWLDPAVADSDVYVEHWAGHRALDVTIGPDAITIRRTEER